MQAQQTAALRLPEGPGRFIVHETGAEIDLPTDKPILLVGRSDPAIGLFPDLDLAPHNGELAGVSRQHARLVVHGNHVNIEDLNSTNMTFLNRQKLIPGQSYPLQDGDEIRFGLMVLTFQARLVPPAGQP